MSPDFAAAAVPGNDAVANAFLLSRDVRVGADTTDATSTGESTTGCPFGWDGTVWYRVKGNGGTMIFDTWGSDIDTMIAVYSGGTSLGCFDTRGDPTEPGNEQAGIVITNSRAGADYYVQVGNPGGTTPGLLALSYVASDDRAHPGALTAGSSDRTTVGASSAAGELLQCRGVPYASTTWYRVNLTEPGTLRFSATGVGWNPAVTLYRAGSTAPLPGCGLPNAARTAGVATYLPRGAYDIQVGGTDDWGYFTYNFSFDVDPDEDGDLYNRQPYNGPRPPDCVDTNRSIHPGAWDGPDRINNDCDAFVDEDVDHDNYDARFAGGNDCRPNDQNIHPGAHEVRGNNVDENCDDVKLDWPEIELNVAPFVVPTGSRWRFRTLPIGPIPKGGRLRVTCKRGGCPHGSFKKKFRHRKANFTGAIKFAKRISMGSRTIVEVRVTARHKQGKVIQFKLRRVGGKVQPKRFERCLRLGSRKPSKCR